MQPRKGVDGGIRYDYKPFQDEKGNWHCGARTKVGKPCEIQTGGPWKCGRHKRSSSRGKAGRPPKHGRYSKFLKKTLDEAYQEFLADKDLLDLRSEVALLRARLAENPDAPLRTVILAVDTIGRLVDRIISFEQERRFYIHISRLQVLQTNVAQLVLSVLNQCPHCGKSLEVLRTELAEKLASIKLIEG